MNQNTCVIIPVYNKDGAVRDVVNELSPHFANILCVDDGCTDDSVAEIMKTNATLIRHSTNRGQGAALRTGIEHALKNPQIKYFITFDADGQHRTQDALKMLNHIRRHRVDIVMGSRFLGSAQDIPIVKRWILKAAILFSNATTGLKLTDTHNGLRVFNRAVASKMRLRCAGMAHASEIIYRIAENKFRYAEVPVTILYTDYSRANGQSMLNSFGILKELMAYRLEREK